MTLMYNGVQFAPVSTRRSIMVPLDSAVVWSVVGKFGRQAVWMGSVEGQRIFTQLLVGLRECSLLFPEVGQSVLSLLF